MPELATEPGTPGSTEATPPPAPVPVDPQPDPPAPPAAPAAEPPVVGHGGQEMAPEAISDRVGREQKKWLREHFGTDDPEEVKRMKSERDGRLTKADGESKELDRLRRQELARQRSRQTREQRATSDIEQRDTQIADLRNELKGMRDASAVSEQNVAIDRLAAEHIDPDAMKYVRRDFSQYVIELREKEPAKFKAMGNKQISRWFANYAANEGARFAKKVETKPTNPAPVETKPVRRVAVTTGKVPKSSVNTPAPADGPGVYKGKAVRPGQPNSMNKAEFREYKKVTGRNY